MEGSIARPALLDRLSGCILVTLRGARGHPAVRPFGTLTGNANDENRIGSVRCGQDEMLLI